MKKLAKVTKTTTRKELLEIMRDSYLYKNQREARYSLGATCVAIRNWMIAFSAAPPEEVMSRLTIPGVGAIRIGWYEYADGTKHLRLRFTPTKKVAMQIRSANKIIPGTIQKGKEHEPRRD
jgi:hypothetical protein